MTFDDATSSDFVILESNIVQTELTVSGLTSGLSYKFKVQARNSFGLSAYSEILELTSGFKPDQPAMPVTVVSAN